VLRLLRGDPRPFLLVGDWAGGGAIAGSAPLEGPVPAVPEALAGPEGAVGGGWFGVLGFGLGAAIERLPPSPRRPLPRPVTDVAFYDHVLRMTPDGAWFFEALVTPARRAALDARLAELRRRRGERRPWRLRGMRPAAPGHDGHRWAVADAVRRIAEGELFQANLCLRLEGELDGDPLDAFADASARLRPAMGAFLATADGGAVLSFSPELFLRRTGRTAWTAPIKGTAPRPADDPEAAARHRAVLTASAKDAAEHVMIVDLMRNDLGRVARYGTVTADPEPSVEPHPGLWHLVSTVRAELRDEVTDAGLVRATFPPGSVTGAPKVQALHVIAALEGTAREAYTGAIGFASPVAGLHVNVAIRTFEVQGRDVWLGCGGGIVADSDPDAELREALGKARPLVEALGGRVAEPGPWRRRPVPALLGGPRPDPAAGLLETVRVRDGEAQHLDRHLERLARSARRLGLAWAPDVRALALAVAGEAGAGVHRLRIVLRAGGEAVVEVLPAAADPAPVTLRPVCLPGGLGEHKWADRAPLSRWPAGEAGLIVDADGAVLEASFANVWLLEGDRAVTPPADGRILPGLTRERVLERGLLLGRAVVVDEVDLPRLERADAVLLTSSIGLVTAVGEAAGEAAAAARAELELEFSGGASARSASAAPGADRGTSPAGGPAACS
jgi:para-aminobenzoate synthetase/4-amino-4-deoxychorismate lyase